LLKKIGKKVVIVCDAKPPKIYDFLSQDIKIRAGKINGLDYDAVIIVDCPELSRIGRAGSNIIKGKPILNIDHHVSNKYFGDANLVDPVACSVGEIIYDLFKKMKIEIDRQSAVALYTAIMTDTGSFRYENTTPKCMRIAGELLEYDVNPQKLSEMIYETSKFSEMKLLGLTLFTMRKTKDGKICWMKTTNDMVRKVSARKSSN
ncbi:MAG: hypothetical protein NT030_06695, partial [Candidatus Saganbacteria bacterium]|nr:hypothetical protein [Candidatus Saganbacteria bacterium]